MKITIKVGSSTLTHKSGNLNIRRMEKLVKVLSDLKNEGHEIVLVSSGAIAMGVGKLPIASRPSDIPGKQAAAAVGQCELMYIYDRLFGEYNHVVGQILITKEDLEEPERRCNLENTLFKLFEYHAIPIINENDSISTAEIAVGDNDTLGAHIATAVQSDLLIILSDINGLYTADPHKNPDAKLLHTVTEITPDITALAGGAGSHFGTGGMATKLSAAQIATESGMDVVIANGSDPSVLYDIVAGKEVGTRFLSHANE